MRLPIQNGSLAEGSSQETILIHLMKNFLTFFTHHPNIYITAPTDITEVERRAYYKILSGRLRAKSVMLVEKGVADAAGIGMPLDSPEGQMIVNLGGDRTEISVISEGKTIIQRTLRTGGPYAGRGYHEHGEKTVSAEYWPKDGGGAEKSAGISSERSGS